MKVASNNSGKFMFMLAILALAAVLVVQATGILAPAPVEAAPTVTDTAALPRTITVVGVGTVTALPDMGTATIGVEITAPTVREATSEAGEKMDSVMAALKAQGVAEKDIQTSNYSIYYEERYRSEMPALSEGSDSAEPAGVYRVSNMVSIKIRDMDRVAQVIDAVVEAGANSLWGVNFVLDDTSEVEGDARARAIENATARAEDLARLSNVSLGEVVEVTEVIGSSPYYGGYGLESAKVGGLGGGPVSPGELEVAMQVQVTFAIQ